ncbi:actin maturation protease isoform X2 [Dasypus novemcinctus]|uniref:actin maturation protease isoform X2 n=1 Tax=Dasypus novemcinctus TaxID=9361 RepID=UPI000328A413|nr:actin maturation protease isoform X2 [Dasypus novemcinctus]XP_058136261.1 actin maturation protease isoform X2 [Dasypus novemcinctus]
MTSPCSTPLEHPVSQSALAPKAVIMPPLPQTLSPSESDFSPHPLSLQILIPPPPPPPPPPPIKGTAPPHVFGMEKSQLLKEALEKAGPVPRGREDIKRLLKLHKDRFRSDLQWILFCADLPSLIQEGPQCGLVALWMAGTLLVPPGGIPLESLVQVAKERGYTAQGEMFSVADMGKLAQEVLGCQAELLCGGLGSPNRDRVLQHLIAGQPLLIPYDEDFNHEPCQRRGHKAHWAVSAGVLLGVQGVPGCGYAEDPELAGLFHPLPGMLCQLPCLPEEGSPGAVYLLSKQGKSWHYQLWDYDQVRESNLQLTDFSPSRAADGRAYVVPAGGVQAGLCGQALLLRPQDSSH